MIEGICHLCSESPQHTSENELNDAVARAIDEWYQRRNLRNFFEESFGGKMVSILEYDKEWEEKKSERQSMRLVKTMLFEICTGWVILKKRLPKLLIKL